MRLNPWVGGLAVIASLPFWLPRVIVGLRMRLFTRINGEEGIAIPGPLVDVAQFKEIYAHPAAKGRSQGAALSDLFWYWLSPGPEVHQEHLEMGERYQDVAHCTHGILTVPRTAASAGLARSMAKALDRTLVEHGGLVRLRDLMMPVFADFYYDLVFREECPDEARALIVANATDVVGALKLTRLRHMDRRARLTRFVRARIAAGRIPHRLPASLTLAEQAHYVQGVFFNTAIVQSSEAMAHLLLFLAQNPPVQAKLAAHPEDERYMDHVVNESLRACPLFGVAHRIARDDIPLANGSVLPKGSVLCFNYPAFHQAGYHEPRRFNPDRWETLSPREANFIPFGVAANRPCPAQFVASVTLREATRQFLRRFVLHSSAEHTRSLPNRGPCLLVPRGAADSPTRRYALLACMRVRDEWENVGRSLTQLALGAYMVWDARRQGLCRNHFARAEAPSAPRGLPNAGGRCPFHAAGREPGAKAAPDTLKTLRRPEA